MSAPVEVEQSGGRLLQVRQTSTDPLAQLGRFAVLRWLFAIAPAYGGQLKVSIIVSSCVCAKLKQMQATPD